MTVCVAVLCDKGKTIVAVADRMVVKEHRASEPLSKIKPITDSIVALIAGDVGLQTELYDRVLEAVSSLKKQAITVKKVAELYRDCFINARQERIENEVVSLYGIDIDTWKNRQNTLSKAVADTITEKAEYFEMPNISTIIAGIDDSGGNLYIVDNDKIICRNFIGYATVGNGSRIAESELLANGYVSNFCGLDAILIAHTAKKRSEIMQGVGSKTDLRFISDKNLEPLGDTETEEFINSLDLLYNYRREKEQLIKLEVLKQYYDAINETKTKNKTTKEKTAKGRKEKK